MRNLKVKEDQATAAKKISDLIDKIIDFESGDMDGDDMIPFFQDLIDSGLCWSLQGSYGRQAQVLIDSGFCHPKED